MLAAGYGAVGEFHYVHHGPDGTPYDEPNALALAVAAGGARRSACEIVLLPAAYHRGGHPRFQRLRDVESFLARVDALREWADGRDGVSVGVAAHSVRAVPPDWLEAIAGYAERPRARRATSTPTSSRASCASAAPSTAPARSSCSRAPASSGPRTSVIHAIHVDERDVALLADSGHDRRHLPDDRGQPRRRRTCRRWPTATPACGWRSAPTRRCASTRSRRRASSRPARAARARTRRALLAHHGDLWAELARNGLASLGLRGRRDRSTSTSSTPTCAASASDELALALATCASAGVVCRQASRVRAGGGSLS